MKKISDKDYSEYQNLLEQKRNGEILTFDGLELILKANGFEPSKVGIHLIESYFKILRDRSERG